MYCKKCGQELMEGEMFCGKCGEKVYSNKLNGILLSKIIRRISFMKFLGKNKFRNKKIFSIILCIAIISLAIVIFTQTKSQSLGNLLNQINDVGLNQDKMVKSYFSSKDVKYIKELSKSNNELKNLNSKLERCKVDTMKESIVIELENVVHSRINKIDSIIQNPKQSDNSNSDNAFPVEDSISWDLSDFNNKIDLIRSELDSGKKNTQESKINKSELSTPENTANTFIEAIRHKDINTIKLITANAYKNKLDSKTDTQLNKCLDELYSYLCLKDPQNIKVYAAYDGQTDEGTWDVQTKNREKGLVVSLYITMIKEDGLWKVEGLENYKSLYE